MIQFNVDHVLLSIDVAKALLLFAAPKKTHKPELIGIGVHYQGALVATDGHALVFFEGQGEAQAYHGKVFPREYVERQLKLAAVDKEYVRLFYRQLSEDLKYPDVGHVIPPKIRNQGAGHSAGVRLVAEYLARLVSVQLACFPKKGAVPHIELTGCDQELNPVRFDCGRNDPLAIEKATVIFMPARSV